MPATSFFTSRSSIPEPPNPSLILSRRFPMLLFLIVLIAALAFEYINGFHDAANAIATVVSTKVLTPRQAIALAACFNLFGAFMGTAVAKTIGAGQVDVKAVTMSTVLAAL